MTDDALLVVQSLFSVIWRLFTSWYIPGTNVTPAVMALFLAAAGIGLRLLIRFFDANSASGDVARTFSTKARRDYISSRSSSRVKKGG